MKKFHLRQLFDKISSTYTYILSCTKTKEGVIIDSVLENVERDLNILKELDIFLKYTIDTHIHADR
jgi:sulfur dioxygenase